jgi:hypothetical protein
MIVRLLLLVINVVVEIDWLVIVVLDGHRHYYSTLIDDPYAHSGSTNDAHESMREQGGRKKKDSLKRNSTIVNIFGHSA